ncbi:MAG TPA: phosphomannomutase/phosphoglucomutase [Vicinamibacteria bacterium]|nr:phosphomannomutase/phosphoglucomutase [Vicinamibacteria bacterium]
MAITQVDPSIFKAYDVRAIHPTQIDGEVARRVGRAFVDYLKAKTIAVGRDVRLSSPEIASGFIAGARSEGCDVVDIGVAGTDMMYFHVASRGLDGGAIITASHNPKEYNGIKMVRRGAYALSGDAGIKEIKEAVMAGRFSDEGTGRGGLRAETISDDYAEHCLSFAERGVIRRGRAVLDPGNGMGAVGAAAVFARLPLETVRMYFDLDGTFPNHPPDPLVEENRREIAERVRAEKADLGIAWDGDADRCFFIDDTGEFVPGDFVTALLGEAFCGKEKGAKIVYDVRASRAVKDRVEAAGGTALMHRVGHAFIKKRMRDENAVFGGEVSGHFYFRDNWFADNGMIPAVVVLEMLGRSGRRFSELLAPLRERYHISGEINSRVSDVEGALRRLEEKYRDGRVLKLDGLSVDYDDWHFNVRPSNTEPLLRLNLEAYARADMERRRDEVLEIIRKA